MSLSIHASRCPQPCTCVQGPKNSTPHPSKHSAKCIVTGNTSLAHLAIPAMMPSIVGVPTREESTARGAKSPAKPACTATAKCITVLLSIQAMMQRVRACERQQGTQREVLNTSNTSLAQATASEDSFWSITAMMQRILGLTTGRNTARGAESTEKPASIV